VYEELLQHADTKRTGFLQEQAYLKHCTKPVQLMVGQKYVIEATHFSNRNHPLGLSWTPDGIHKGGRLYLTDGVTDGYIVNDVIANWEAYTTLWKTTTSRHVKFRPMKEETLYFFSANPTQWQGKGGTAQVVDTGLLK
jgi:hypothetical protein